MFAFGQGRWGRPSLKAATRKITEHLGGEAGTHVGAGPSSHRGKRRDQPQALYTSCSQPGERRRNNYATQSAGQLLESQSLDALVGFVQTSLNKWHPSWTWTEATGIEITGLNLCSKLISRWKPLKPCISLIYWAISEASKFL